MANDFQEYRLGEYVISTNPEKLEIPVIHNFLRNSYWAKGIPIQLLKKSIDNSLCFGIYFHGRQVGFARIISDFATYAYLADVFVVEGHRGKGLSKWMMRVIMEFPDLQGLRRFQLATKDAHGLYRKFGFRASENPSVNMEITVANIYLENNEKK